MKRIARLLCCLLLGCLPAQAWRRTVQNRPYTDLRPLHFGVLVGTHVQDMELTNVGPQTLTLKDGTAESSVVVDQDRWDMGFHVGVLGELRLGEHFQLRVAPAMYFGSHHLVFRNLLQTDAAGVPLEQRQELKTASFSTDFNLIFSAPRFNNHRPYLMAGLNPMLNLGSHSRDYLKLAGSALMAEVGVGCDFYLPFFKLRPELKFAYNLKNSIDTKHAARLDDEGMLPYAGAAKEARTKMVVLTFYFE